MPDSGPCNTWVTHDLSTFLDDADLFGGLPCTQFSSGALQYLGSGGTFGTWEFTLPSLYLPTDVPFKIEVTFAVDDYDGATGLNTTIIKSLGSVDSAVEATIGDDGNFLGGGPNVFGSNVVRAGAVFTSTVGPGVYSPDPAGLQSAFDTDVVSKGYRYCLFQFAIPAPPGPGTQIVQVRTMKVCATGPAHAPPLRLYPRSDGLGTSSARRLWPPDQSVQASNRRAGGYL